MCLRSESWAFIAPAFWHGPWSTTASLSLGWAVPDMACSEFRTGRTAPCLVVCQRLSHCRSLHPDLFFVNRPRLLVPRLSSHFPTLLLHIHATKECPSHSLADLVTAVSLDHPSSLPTLRQTISATQPLGHSSLPLPDPITSYPSHPTPHIAHSQNSRLSAATSMTCTS